MPYVKRDDNGAIVAVHEGSESGFSEEVKSDDSELQQFLNKLRGEVSIVATDHPFIRVLEDVVELLIDKQVILFTDLPDSAQEKIIQRQRLRTHMTNILDLIGDD